MRTRTASDRDRLSSWSRVSRFGRPIFFKVVPEEAPRNEEKPHPCFPHAFIPPNEPIVEHPKWSDASCSVDSNTYTSRYRVSFEIQMKKHPQVKYIRGQKYSQPMYRSHSHHLAGKIPVAVTPTLCQQRFWRHGSTTSAIRPLTSDLSLAPVRARESCAARFSAWPASRRRKPG